MVDIAFKNASVRKDQIAQRLIELRAEMRSLEKEAAELDSFIEMWRKLSSMTDDQDSAGSIESAVPAGEEWSGTNPPRERVGDVAQEILLAVGKPLPINLLYDELQRRGVIVRGKKPIAVLNTMMWRMSDRFQKVPGLGYWLAKTPFTIDWTTEADKKS